MIQIDLLGLVLAGGFVAAVAALSRALGLGLGRSLLIAASRTYLQLILLGYVLVAVFARDQPLITGAVFGLMILFSAHTIHLRLRELPAPVFLPVLAAVSAGGLVVTLLVVAAVLRVEPFWQARYWLPIGGMVLGNSMNGIALAVDRLFADLDRRRDQVKTLLSLGASRAETLAPSIRICLRAGLMPTINNMAAVGVVSIPGMMTGQVLAGADPAAAARYQIVVMFMIAAATAAGAGLAVALLARRAGKAVVEGF